MKEEFSALERYRYHLRHLQRSEGTIKQRVGDIVRLRESVGDPLLLDKSALAEFLEENTGQWSLAYRKKVYISYRMFFRWAKKNSLIEKNPARKLPAVIVPRYLPRPAPEEVVLEAFDTATTAEAAMLCLGSTQGLRRTEIAQAHPQNRDGDVLRVIGKNSKVRDTPLDSMTLTLLRQLESEQGVNEYYFPGRFSGHIHPTTVYKWLKKHLGSEWSTHNLRHRAASNGLRLTHNLRGVQDLLGHESLATTQVYTFVAPDELREIVEANSLRAKLAERKIQQLLAKRGELPPEVEEDQSIIDALLVLNTFVANQKQAE